MKPAEGSRSDSPWVPPRWGERVILPITTKNSLTIKKQDFNRPRFQGMKKNPILFLPRLPGIRSEHFIDTMRTIPVTINDSVPEEMARGGSTVKNNPETFYPLCMRRGRERGGLSATTTPFYGPFFQPGSHMHAASSSSISSFRTIVRHDTLLSSTAFLIRFSSRESLPFPFFISTSTTLIESAFSSFACV